MVVNWYEAKELAIKYLQELEESKNPAEILAAFDIFQKSLNGEVPILDYSKKHEYVRVITIRS